MPGVGGDTSDGPTRAVQSYDGVKSGFLGGFECAGPGVAGFLVSRRAIVLNAAASLRTGNATAFAVVATKREKRVGVATCGSTWRPGSGCGKREPPIVWVRSARVRRGCGFARRHAA